MYNFDELNSYGEPNDIEPDQPAPREPEGPPDTTTPAHHVWLFDADQSETVQDAYVVARNPLPLDFRMWVFVGAGDEARFTMRASHKYGPDEFVPGGRDDCCEVLFAGQSLSSDHCPEEVASLVEELTGGSVVYPDDVTASAGKDTDDGPDSPVNY